MIFWYYRNSYLVLCRFYDLHGSHRFGWIKTQDFSGIFHNQPVFPRLNVLTSILHTYGIIYTNLYTGHDLALWLETYPLCDWEGSPLANSLCNMIHQPDQTRLVQRMLSNQTLIHTSWPANRLINASKCLLTHLDQDKMAANLQMTYTNLFNNLTENLMHFFPWD